MFSCIIKNVKVADGTGYNKTFNASVGLDGAYIKAIEKEIPDNLARIVYDGKGKLLTPGFIDIHGHSDISILAAPEATGKISQGVTTEICGNCGLSVFPLTHLNREHIADIYKRYNFNISWDSFFEYAQIVNKIKPAINILSLCGHNTLTAAVYGYEKYKDSAAKLKIQTQLLGESLDSGAAGFSLGLLYVPGIFANKNEIKNLMHLVSNRNKFIAAHIRNEGDEILNALNEYLELGTSIRAGKIHISHLKISGKKNWNKLKEVLSIIQQTSDRFTNCKLTADRYPYTESMTQLSVFMPEPYSEIDDKLLSKTLENKSELEKFINILSIKISTSRWKELKIISSESNFLQSMALIHKISLDKIFGQSIDYIAKIINISPEILCAKLLQDDASGTTASASGMCYDNMHKILAQPFVCCSSDETARPYDYSIGRSHPRGFGSFPKFIKLISPILGIENSIRKMTSLPAFICGLKNRGIIAPGYYADLVLLDMNKIMSPDRTPDFIKPHTLSDGIEKVWVNGKLSFSKESTILERNGSLISIHK
jgi:N-acyl-D-amino-acid deacylase